jgi:hypothetical protein
VSAPAEPPSLPPGLHIEVDADPIGRAARAAGELGADLCTTPREVDGLLAEREAFPRLSSDALETLRWHARRMAAAQGVVEGTVNRATVEVGERLAVGGSGVAIHPSTVRDRAAAVVAAREALTVAEARLRAAEEDAARAPAAPSLEPLPSLAVPLPDPPDRPDEVAPPRRRLPWFGRKGRGRREDEEYASESTSLLQQVAASTEEAFGARATAAQDDRLVLLRAQRDGAQEQVRVAERSWHDLAGGDDVGDVEAVIRRFDPQHQLAVELAQQTVGVRAVSGLLDDARAGWDRAWRSLGLDPPDGVDQSEVDRMVDQLARPVVLVATAAPHAELVALAVPAAPVLVIKQTAS